MTRATDNAVNPLTGRNGRGFRISNPVASVEKGHCRIVAERALPAGYSIVSFRYKPFGVPRDSVVEIKVRRPNTAVDTLETRVPIDPGGSVWGGPVPAAMARFLKDRY